MTTTLKKESVRIVLKKDDKRIVLRSLSVAGGEVNSGENVNTGGGVGVFEGKVATVLGFRGVNVGPSNLLTVALDSDKEIVLDVDTDQLMADLNPQLIRNVDDDTANKFMFIGDAPTGTATSAAAWRIFRFDFNVDSSADIKKKYAEGSTDFDQVWDDRASLSYS